MPRDARVDVEDMDHGKLKIALNRIPAIAAKARTLTTTPKPALGLRKSRALAGRVAVTAPEAPLRKSGHINHAKFRLEVFGISQFQKPFRLRQNST
jgi:hypothetical protein